MVKVLVIKTSALGDVIQVYPCIKAIKAFAPDAEIDWVVESIADPLVRTHPDVNQVIDIHTKKWRKSPFAFWDEIKQAYQKLRSKKYDVLFDFQGNTKSALLTYLARAEMKIGFGKSAPEWPATLPLTVKVDPVPGKNIRDDYLSLVSAWTRRPEACQLGTTLTISHQAQKHVDDLLERRSKGKNILVCPFSRWVNKQLTDESLLGFLKKLQAEGTKVWILYGSHDEHKRAKVLHSEIPESELVDPLPFPAMQRLMQGMDQVIAVDSFALSLAAESQVPTFALFGSSSLEKYNPPGVKHFAYQGACPYGKTFEKRCPILRTCISGSCIHDISADKLVELYKTTGRNN